jgi:hypothetical protein
VTKEEHRPLWSFKLNPPIVLLSYPFYPSRCYVAHYVLLKLRSYNYVAKCERGLTEWALVTMYEVLAFRSDMMLFLEEEQAPVPRNSSLYTRSRLIQVPYRL